MPSLDDAVATPARRGHPVTRGPVSPSPGVRFSSVRDPDGSEAPLIEHRA